MSHLKIYEALNSQFAKISEISFRIKQKDFNCIERLKEWLLTSEQLLRGFNYNESLEMAGFRGQLIASQIANNQKIPDEHHDINVLLELVEPAKDTMINVISPVELKIREAEKIIKDLLEEQLEMHQFSWNHGLNYRDFILAVWRTLLKQENTKELAHKVKTLVGEEDALNLISNQIKIEI